MKVSVFKYLSPASIYLMALLAFSMHGWLTWLPMLYAWVLLPFLELFLNPDDSNMDAAEEELARQNKWYDYMLYIIVVFQYGILIFFLSSMKDPSLAWWEIMGRIFSMGLLCGTFGINSA